MLCGELTLLPVQRRPGLAGLLSPRPCGGPRVGLVSPWQGCPLAGDGKWLGQFYLGLPSTELPAGVVTLMTRTAAPRPGLQTVSPSSDGAHMAAGGGRQYEY